jgi:hypothetical protein
LFSILNSQWDTLLPALVQQRGPRHPVEVRSSIVIRKQAAPSVLQQAEQPYTEGMEEACDAYNFFAWTGFSAIVVVLHIGMKQLIHIMGAIFGEKITLA